MAAVFVFEPLVTYFCTKQSIPMNALDQLKQFTRIVADTGDFESIEQYKPIDATTNPSLIFQAAGNSKYSRLIAKAVDAAKEKSTDKEQILKDCLDMLAVNFGAEILKIVPGRVSTEVDARLSFDTEATVNKARKLISLYNALGFSNERILIKIAATWEGIKAAEILEKEDIHTNLTLLFSKVQAIACAHAGVKLISPFVGRILDWHLVNQKLDKIAPEHDPGVLSVGEIFNYYKKFGHKTEIMGASFRNTGEILELAGCDLLTIAPALLAELGNSNEVVTRKLTVENAAKTLMEEIHPDEKLFRWLLNEDAMATEKLAEGIRKFTADLLKLEKLIITGFL
jgi:transaldolase